MDLWCALCAVGPTYLLPVLSALAEAAASQGLEPTAALDAAAETFAGTARMVQRSGRTPEQLKLMIGLRTLKEEEARRVFAEAYTEAVKKLKGLGEKLAAGGGIK
jgi:pyrroline-5-carboxylate reductase